MVSTYADWVLCNAVVSTCLCNALVSTYVDWVLCNALVSTHADWNSNDMHGKILLRKAHGDRIFILIREKYKKHENIFDSKPNNILFKIYFLSIF